MLVDTAGVFAPQRILPGDSGLKHKLSHKLLTFPEDRNVLIVAEGY